MKSKVTRNQLVSVSLICITLLTWNSVSTPAPDSNADSNYTYSYSDNFLTDKVVFDCYSNSSSRIFYYDGPDISLCGYLVLWPMPFYDVLAFYPGSELFCDATLVYRFTLGSTGGLVVDGNMTLSLMPFPSSPSAYMRVVVNYDDGSVEDFGNVSTGGVILFSLTVPDSSKYVEVVLVGKAMYLDYFGIDLQMTEASSICGDADGNGTLDIDDVIYLINYVYIGGDPPLPTESGDINCDGKIDLLDIARLTNYIFRGGSAPCDTNGDGEPEC
jgi:hypothetical protein